MTLSSLVGLRAKLLDITVYILFVIIVSLSLCIIFVLM